MLSINIDPVTLAIILSAASAIYACIVTIIRPILEKKKPFASIPMPSGSHWLKGHLETMGRDFAYFNKVMTAYADKNGRTGLWTAKDATLILTQWEDAQTVLRSESNRHKNFIARKHTAAAFGKKNILSLNGKEWKLHRAALNKAFTPAALQAAEDAMLHVTETLTASVKDQIAQSPDKTYECNIEQLMKMVTLDIFGQSALSHDFGTTKSLESSPLALSFDVLSKNAAKRAETGFTRPENFFYSVPTEHNTAVTKARKTVDTFLNEMVVARRADKGKHNDLLSLLLAVDGDDESLTDSLRTVLFAGYDTTSITLTYALYMLSQHPEVQDKVVEELEAFGSSGNVDDLVYLNAVIQETLRLYPSAPSTSRTLTKPVTLRDGFEIPEGSQVMLPIWSLHRNEDNFPRAEEFLPERWAKREGDRWVDREPTDTSSDVPAGNPKAFFAFSGGGRNCAGKKFAYQELSIVLSGLLKDLRFEALPDYKLQPKREIPIQHPHDGLPMKVMLR